ncbi:hypothetical protein [Actinopolyspora erythraea]|uniref:hypothetical protein n=1 Tax=Actinopolyspora erythraea TaxID=414996 RepID=UPI0012B50BAB|nr:hypothetical protein [Actinopolyspora erythraea]
MSEQQPTAEELIRLARENPEEFGKWFANADDDARQAFTNAHGDATANRRDQRKKK